MQVPFETCLTSPFFSRQRMKTLLEKIIAIQQQYRRDRINGSMCVCVCVLLCFFLLVIIIYMHPNMVSHFDILVIDLSYNDEQIHKFEK